MSLRDCLKKHGLDKHEAAILRGDARDLMDDGVASKEAAIQAVKDRLATYTQERRDIVSQIQKQGGAVGAPTEYFQAAQPEKDLYISHNLSIENLLHADKVGGLAVPSLAIARTGTGFEGFGEISLIADKSLLQDRAAKTFGADIYSPRYPQVTYKIDWKKYYQIADSMNDELASAGLGKISADIESRGLQELFYSTEARYLYFKSIDKAPKLTYKKKEPIPAALRKFKGGEYSISSDPEFIKAAKKYYQDKAEKHARDVADASDGSDYEYWLKDWTDTFFNEQGDVHLRFINELAYTVSKYSQPKQVDTYSLDQKLSKKLISAKVQEGFKQWIDDTFSDAVAAEQIFRGFTPSGNRKYIAHTLDNVVKIMKKELRGGENFNYGVGTIRSGAAPQFKSIKAIQNARNKIIAKDAMDKLKEETDADFDAVVEALRPYYKYESNSFGFLDAAAENLYEMARGKGLQDFENVPDDVRTNAAEFLAKLRDMPTEYFESKIQRAVGIDEFVAAVVPKGTPQKAKDILKRSGIKVREYNPKIDGDRAAKIASLDKSTRILFQSEPTAEPFYSGLLDAAENLKQAKGNPAQMLAMLKKQGVKQEEVEWLDLEEWIKEQGKSVTREAIADFIRANQIQIEEVEKGAEPTLEWQQAGDTYSIKGTVGYPRIIHMPSNDMYRLELGSGIKETFSELSLAKEEAERSARLTEGEDTKFASYQLPGGKEYRELLLTLPISKENTERTEYINSLIAKYNVGLYELKNVVTEEEYNKWTGLAQKDHESRGKSSTYKGGHYDEPNILAHIRFNERTDADGKRVLFIEEVQSDWHQAGRKEGYQGVGQVKQMTLQEAFEADALPHDAEGMNSMGFARGKATNDMPVWVAYRQDGTVAGVAHNNESDAREMINKGGVPDAPFKTTWPLLSMKRMIRYAAENGFDRIAWTTGEQQADRYDLSKQIDAVNVAKGDGDLYMVDIEKDGNRVDGKRLTESELEDYIGKELAKKIIEHDDVQNGLVTTFSGVDLKVGGEGMKGFYDNILPKTVNKYVKKWGGKVGETKIDTGESPQYDSQILESLALDMINGDMTAAEFNEEVDMDLLTDDDVEGFGFEDYTASDVAEEVQKRLSEKRGEVPVHSLDITDQMRDVALKGQPLFQPGKRGSIQFGDNQTIINLFKAKNLSTFLHESGHLFLDVMQDISSRPDATPELKEEWARIEKSLGLKAGEQLTTEHHEKWARSFEAYLREGKAPSPELRSAFQSFRRWLLSVYKTVKQLLGKDILTDDIRGIFDRMLATDAQLEASQSDGYNAIFESAEKMGITDREFKEYQKVAQEVRDKAQEGLDIEAINEAKREREQEWSEARARMQAQVEIEINQRPDIRAKHFLMRGEFLPGDPLAEIITEPVKIDKADLMAMYEGTDFVHQLRRLPPGKNQITAKEGGLHPDAVAEMFGYKSGDSLIRAILDAGSRTALIKSETDARMSAEYGDMRADIDRVAKMAVDALHSDKRAHFLMLELKALNKRTGAGQTQASVLKQVAERLIDESKVPEAARVERFLTAERKAGRNAEKAVADGDFDAARDAKRQQLLNHYLYMMARDAKAEQAKFLRFFGKFDKKGTRKALKGEHLDQIDSLLEQYDFRKVPLKAVAERQSLRLWVEAQKADGLIPNIPDSILDDVGRTNYKELTMSEFRGLYDSIKSIEAIARNENVIKAGEEYIDYESAIAELSESAYEYNKAGAPLAIDEGVKGPAERLGSWVKDKDASLLKIEQMVAWLDGDKPDGPWRKYLFKPVADAEHLRNDIDVAFTARLIEAMQKLPKDHAKRLHQKVYVESLRTDMTRAGLVAMALNTGTESNYFKLIEGSKQLPGGGFTEAEVQAALDTHLTKEDWDFITSIWSILDDQGDGSLFDMLNKVEKELTGTPIKKVKGRKVETPFGTFEGGYVPIVYDRRFSKAGMTKADEIGDTPSGRPSTKSGSVNERIETFAAPLKLDLFSIPHHISEVTQDVTHRRVVRDTWKILSDQRIRKVIQDTLGEEYEPQFRKWVAHVANDKMVDQTGVDGWIRIIQAARLNTSVVAMGFKYTTVIQQPLGITQSIDVMREMEGGKLYLAKEVKNFSKQTAAYYGKKLVGVSGAFEMKETVFAKSGEMRHRMSNLDRDLRDNLRKRLGKKGRHAEMVRMAFMGIALSDMSVSLPTWMASYKWAIDNQYTEAQAIEWADSRVRLSQGSGSAKDLSAVQRGHEAMKLLTVFYSYFNAYYQRIRDSGRMTESIKDVPEFFLRHWYITIIPAIFSELMSGRGPDEDEEWEDWAVRQVVTYPFLTVPLVRDVASAVESGFGYDFTPAGAVFEHTGRLISKADDWIEGDADFSDVLEQAVKTSGYFLALPTGQAIITFKHLSEVAEGDTDFNPYYLLVREPEK